MAPKRRILGLTLRQHIGGRWAISWQIYVLNLPLNALAVSTVISSVPQASQWWGWLLVSLVGPAVIAGLFVVADVTWMRHRRITPVPVWSVSAWGALIGVVRVLAVVGAAQVLGLQTSPVTQTLPRAVWAAVLGAIALPLGALALSTIASFRHERDRLLREGAAAERRRMQREGQVAALRFALVQDVREEIEQVLVDLHEAEASATEVSEAVRQTSHRLWDSSTESGATDVRHLRLLRAAWRPHRIPALAIALIWSVFALPSMVSVIGMPWAMVDLLLSFGVLWAAFAFADAWGRRRPGQWGLAIVVMTAVAYLIVSPGMHAIFQRQAIEVVAPLLVVNALWLPLVVALLVFLAGVVSSSDDILQRLSSSLNETEIASRALGEERDDVLRELATRLHRAVHSPAVARAALSEAQPDGGISAEPVAAQLGRVIASLEADERRDDLTASLQRTAELWRGYLDITCTIDPRIERLDGEASRMILRIVEEGIANAFRHGGARKATIVLDRVSDGILVVISDDGSGPQREGSGLGSVLFDSAAPGGWTLSAGPESGSVLRLLVPSPVPAGAPGSPDSLPH